MVTLSLTNLAEIVVGASFLTALAIFSLRSSSATGTTAPTGESKAGKKKKKKNAGIQGNAVTPTAVIEGVQSVKREVTEGAKEAVKEIQGVSKGLEKVVEEKVMQGKKKTKRVPLDMETAPVIPLPPRPTVPSTNGAAPSFAKIVSPNSTSTPPPITSSSSKPSKSTTSNPLSDMRDLDVDPEDSSARVMKIVDSRPDVNGSEEWREWSAQNGNGMKEDIYEDSGEVKEVEGDWEVAKKRLSPPLPSLYRR